MNLAVSHPWNLPVDEAEALQTRLAAQVIRETTFDVTAVRTVGGVDVGFQGGVARAAAVVIAYPDLSPLDFALGEVPVTFPYIPGLLAFREGPAVLAALEKLGTWPDVFMFDAQGIAHPRRLGLASHVGVILDRPSIGCAKSVLTGRYAEPGPEAGDWTDLTYRDEVIGVVVRTKPRTKPLFVSIGHRINLPAARQLVLACTAGYRLPEPTRLAHNVAGGARLNMSRVGHG